MERDQAGSSPAPDGLILHASCVTVESRAALILGGSGCGKSGLSLQLMALGAALVSDDRTMVKVLDDLLWASAPKALAGLIEARGVGLLCVRHVEAAQVVCAVDLDVTETDRLPERHTLKVAGVALPLLHKVDSPYFPAAVLQYLKAGRRDP